MATLMEARTREFEERAIARGIAQGRAEERREMATLMEARTREFEERAIARGREQGITQGRAEERALLLRLAERRFGAETAAELSELVEKADGAEDSTRTGD